MQRSSLNRVTLVGRIGNKPEGRFTPSGVSTVNFSLATNEVWGGSENRQEHTEWHTIVAWNNIADFVVKYIQKGQMVALEGSLRTRSWKDRDDNVRKTTEVICSMVTPLEWKSESESKPDSVKTASDDEENLPF